MMTEEQTERSERQRIWSPSSSSPSPSRHSSRTPFYLLLPVLLLLLLLFPHASLGSLTLDLGVEANWSMVKDQAARRWAAKRVEGGRGGASGGQLNTEELGRLLSQGGDLRSSLGGAAMPAKVPGQSVGCDAHYPPTHHPCTTRKRLCVGSTVCLLILLIFLQSHDPLYFVRGVV